jgi:signal transduction histidine kinase
MNKPSMPPAQPAAWVDKIVPENEALTLILAPTGSDAALTSGFLRQAGLSVAIVVGIDELCGRITQGCGAVVLAEEVLTHENAMQVFQVLRGQPAWSEIPLVLVTTKGQAGAERLRQISDYGSPGNISVLERPFRPGTLVSALEVALRSRKRQYEVRNLMVQLQQANHAKDEFLAALSHELRTPLSPVLLLATEGASNHDLPEAVRRDFEQIAHNVSLEARLIDDLLDLTRITRGKLSLTLTAVDVHAAVRTALATTQTEFTERRIGVELSLEASRHFVQADPVRLQQVLWNILKNAAKFTPPGGRVRIATTNEGDEIHVAITDTGIGMEPDELARAFEAFAQGNHAQTPGRHQFGGMGLGLAISRRLMELHGGAIEARSAGTGQGSTFVTRLPLSAILPEPVSPVSRARSHHPHPPRDRKRLLLVEDHAPTRGAMRKLLANRGYHVEAAGSLAQARAIIGAQEFDLVLSDLGLPDGSGYELMAELQRRGGVKGIALSGYGMEADVEESKRVGFVAHLTKPVTVQALDAALKAAF